MLSRRSLMAVALAAALLGVGWQQAQAQPGGPRCFSETDQCIEGPFRRFWERNGGLAIFGLPLTPAREERLADGGRSLVQWFERARFELHPELGPDAVLLGRLGSEQLGLARPPSQADVPATPLPSATAAPTPSSSPTPSLTPTRTPRPRREPDPEPSATAAPTAVPPSATPAPLPTTILPYP